MAQRLILALVLAAGCSKSGGTLLPGQDAGATGGGGSGGGGGATMSDMAGGGGGSGGSSGGSGGGGGSGGSGGSGGGGGGTPTACLPPATDNMAASIDPPAGLA